MYALVPRVTKGRKLLKTSQANWKVERSTLNMRLSAGDKKSVERIQEELLKEFEQGNQNREAAIFELNNRKREKDESPQAFSFKLLQLIKLAHPSFQDEVRKTIAKGYFVRGVHPNTSGKARGHACHAKHEQKSPE